MAFDPTMTPHLISAALKEYDALRREIEVRTDATRAYGWPVILFVAGGVAGIKSFDVPPDLALMVIPAGAMTIFALTANASLAMEKARKGLAEVENRIYIISDKPETPSLCHESGRVSGWGNASENKRRFLWAIAATFIYGLLIVSLGWRLRPEDGTWWGLLSKIDWTRSTILYGVMAAPAAFFLYNCVGLRRLRKHRPQTCLINSMCGVPRGACQEEQTAEQNHAQRP